MQLTIFADWKIYLISQYRRIDQIVIDPSCRYAALKVRGATPGTGHAKGRAETRAHLRRNFVRFGSLLLSESGLAPLKGGDPAARSRTATLLRLHPPHPPHLRRLPPCGWAGDFGCRRLGWCDGRCVQGPGTHSPRHADPRLLATPTSWGRVAAPNPNWGRLSGIRSGSRHRIPLYRPL